MTGTSRQQDASRTSRPAATVRLTRRQEPPARPAKRPYSPPSFATRPQLLRALLLLLAGLVWFAPPQPLSARPQGGAPPPAAASR
jgi:hypothetical protein